MLSVLANRTYRHLFAAQVVALLGTGLATVALGLLAYDLAGVNAGAVLGTAFAIKMVAYVLVAPIAAAFADRFNRRKMLVTLDLVRSAVAIFLPFATQIWQIYVLIFVLQSSSAAFTPLFQATIPDVLPDERDYTQALSLSRLAYDLESVASPMLAAMLLAVLNFHELFTGTMLGFLASALLVVSVIIPNPKPSEPCGIYDRTTRGIRIFLATPRLRGLLCLNMAAAAAGAMVIVNTVVLVQSRFALGQHSTAMALAAFGCGSMLAALALPKLLDRLPDRGAMLGGATALVFSLLCGAMITNYFALLALWFFIGLGYSLVLTPSGLLLRRSSQAEDRPALFAAQFALSHVCWLLAYPIAGWVGAKLGLSMTFVLLATIAAIAIAAAVNLWPSQDAAELEHVHRGLPEGHQHLAGAMPVDGGFRHVHEFVIDDYHSEWPGRPI